MRDASPLLLILRKLWRFSRKRLDSMARHKRFRRYYVAGALLLLAVSTVYWAYLGADTQLHNADQLVDPYLFSSWKVFHGAVFPAAHTFLLKWPIFWLVGLFGVTATSLMAATIAVCVITVAVLALVIYKIERRPLVFGSLCLGLALIFMLIPAQPYVGGILPVNMAMLATRNLEYAVYLVCLIGIVRSASLRSRYFIGATVLLSVLIASDKLFLSLSGGGALLMLVVYACARQWTLVTMASRWLVASLAAAVGSTLLLFIVSVTHLTHIAGAAAAPYNLIASGKDAVLGICYAVLGLFTNVGANPVYDNRVLRRLPDSFLQRLISFSGLLHIVAAILLICGLVLAWRLVWPTAHSTSKRPPKIPAANQLALSLVASTITAFGVFIVTQHEYAVDARYLSIALFTLVICAAAVLRKQRLVPARLVLTGLILTLSLIAGGFVAHSTGDQQKAAYVSLHRRDSRIVQALEHHKVTVLAGDYWRVLPIRFASQNTLNTLPLIGCTQPTPTLTSSAWQPNLATHSFAYLISFDANLTNFPNCTLAGVTAAYGRPNATQVIAGSIAQPKEALLFYDHGIQPSLPHAVQAPADSGVITPISLDQLPGTSCRQPTVMNVVAHEDDDLLFLSPDLLSDIHQGKCVRTVFLTAGDSGRGMFYWLARQQGSEAAYSTMLGSKDVWDQQTVVLGPQEYATIASLRGNTKVSLVFLNLPDGDLHGEGFASSGNQSLAKLQAGSIATMASVDGQSVYTSDQLIDALGMLMSTYQPAEIHTQADVIDTAYPDHSDHIATGAYTQSAAAVYDQQHFGGTVAIPVRRYIGYPIHGYARNVSGDDLAQKEAAFLAYARYDGGVCNSLAQCDATPTYGAYLTRQYQQDASN